MVPPIPTPILRLIRVGNGVPVPNGFLPGGFSIDRLQGQRHLDELLAGWIHALAPAISFSRRRHRRRLSDDSAATSGLQCVPANSISRDV